MEQPIGFDNLIEASARVDFADAGDAAGFASLIFTLANEAGVMVPTVGRQSAEAMAIGRLAREWVGNVAPRMTAVFSAGDAMALLEPLDFMHRIGHRVPAPKDLLNRHLLNAFEARMRGDMSVNEYALFRYVSRELSRNNRAFFDRPLRWYAVCLDRWEESFRSGSADVFLQDLDTLEIASLLMGEDLHLFVGNGEAQFKKRLFESHSRYFDRVATLDFNELTALSHLLSSSAAHIPADRYRGYDAAIVKALIDNPLTNRWHRQSLRRALRECAAPAN